MSIKKITKKQANKGLKFNKDILDIFLVKLGFEKEFKFAPNRKFRADYCLVSKKIIVEYEGLSCSRSRHTSITGYSKDCEKYNLAQILGYIVLRYTALNCSNIVEDLEALERIEIDKKIEKYKNEVFNGQ